MTISEQAQSYAKDRHRAVMQLYDGEPYEFHLTMVASTAMEYLKLIPEQDWDVVVAACWVHDVIEDCRETYNDVTKNTCKEVAEIAYALTNEKGKTRADRANEKYYQGIRDTPYATFVKLCDRIANIRHSRAKGSRMIEVYRKEHEDFKKKLWFPAYEEMFHYMDYLLAEQKHEKTATP